MADRPETTRHKQRKPKRIRVEPVHLHEAGHVVAGLAVGLQVRRVWCDAKAGTGQVQWASKERAFGILGTRRALTNQVLVALSGIAAEAHFVGQVTATVDDIQRAAWHVSSARPGVFSLAGRRMARRILAARPRERIAVAPFFDECGRHAREFAEENAKALAAVAAALVGGAATHIVLKKALSDVSAVKWETRYG